MSTYPVSYRPGSLGSQNKPLVPANDNKPIGPLKPVPANDNSPIGQNQGLRDLVRDSFAPAAGRAFPGYGFGAAGLIRNLQNQQMRELFPGNPLSDFFYGNNSPNSSPANQAIPAGGKVPNLSGWYTSICGGGGSLTYPGGLDCGDTAVAEVADAGITWPANGLPPANLYAISWTGVPHIVEGYWWYVQTGHAQRVGATLRKGPGTLWVPKPEPQPVGKPRPTPGVPMTYPIFYPMGVPRPMPWGAQPHRRPAPGYREQTQRGPLPAPKPGTKANPVRRPPRGPEKEVKGGAFTSAGGRLMLILQKAGHGVTEGLDGLDAIHDALPENLQAKKGSTPQQKANAIYKNAGEISIEKAILNLAANHILDAIIGKIAGGAQDWATKRNIILGLIG